MNGRIFVAVFAVSDDGKKALQIESFLRRKMRHYTHDEMRERKDVCI